MNRQTLRNAAIVAAIACLLLIMVCCEQAKPRAQFAHFYDKSVTVEYTRGMHGPVVIISYWGTEAYKRYDVRLSATPSDGKVTTLRRTLVLQHAVNSDGSENSDGRRGADADLPSRLRVSVVRKGDGNTEIHDYQPVD